MALLSIVSKRTSFIKCTICFASVNIYAWKPFSLNVFCYPNSAQNESFSHDMNQRVLRQAQWIPLPEFEPRYHAHGGLLSCRFLGQPVENIPNRLHTFKLSKN